jgi:hypothetical protein
MIRQHIDEDGRIVLTLPCDPPTYADGTPREVTVTLPKGRVLDAVTAHEIVTTLERAARRKGQA